jgi:hypothetical protein
MAAGGYTRAVSPAASQIMPATKLTTLPILAIIIHKVTHD